MTPQALPPLHIDGVAFWAPAWPGWTLAAPALRGEPVAPADPPARRPAPAALAANERRRAPDSVLLALEVAQAAVADSGHDARQLPSVFTSAFGDLPIVDALCRTLADDPLLLSPTRFHHSVHNAASGYWAMASGSHCASTALAAFDHSFAAGLMEAATLCAADGHPVLLVGFDTEACGPLASVNTSRGLLGVALVLAPQRGPRSRWRLDWRLQAQRQPRPRPQSQSHLQARPHRQRQPQPQPQPQPNDDAAPPLATVVRSDAARALAANAMADALPFYEALAGGGAAELGLQLSPGLQLRLGLQPL